MNTLNTLQSRIFNTVQSEISVIASFVFKVHSHKARVQCVDLERGFVLCDFHETPIVE